MIKSKELLRNEFYLFTSKVAANSNYIESISEAKQFFIYAQYFLKGYLKIYEYNITRHGIQMVVKVLDHQLYLNKKEQDSEYWKVISERMRLCLSHYVKKVNKIRGRTGVLVHSSFEKFAFENLGDALKCIENLRKQIFTEYQRKPKYRGLKFHYRIPDKMGKGSIFLCSRELKRVLKRGVVREVNRGIIQLFGDSQELVGLKSSLFNKKSNFKSKTPRKPPDISN